MFRCVDLFASKSSVSHIIPTPNTLASPPSIGVKSGSFVCLDAVVDRISFNKPIKFDGELWSTSFSCRTFHPHLHAPIKFEGVSFHNLWRDKKRKFAFVTCESVLFMLGINLHCVRMPLLRLLHYLFLEYSTQYSLAFSYPL